MNDHGTGSGKSGHADAGVRGRAKALAADLLMVHGYRGVSFGMLAERLSTTRANLHYHFGTKMNMVAEIVDEYAADTAARFGAIWTDEGSSFEDKVLGTYRFNRERFLRINQGEEYGRPWSLIARMRADGDILEEAVIARLREFSGELTEDVREGVLISIRRGELSAETPVDDVVLQITSIINSAGPITQDAGSIVPLEQLYKAFLRMVLAAFGPAQPMMKNGDDGAAETHPRP